jgi:hypothetical protein
VKGGFLLNVVVRKGSSILKLLASENETLLVRGNSLLILDLCLDALNSIRALDLQSNSLSSECLHKNLHVCACVEQ